MPVFYFNAWDGADLLRDDEGVDFPDAAAATTYAARVAREIMRADVAAKRSWLVLILDEERAVVSTVPFAALDPTLDHLKSDHPRELAPAQAVLTSDRC